MKPWQRRNLSTEARATLVTKALWPDASGPQPYILEALEAEAEDRDSCFGCRTVVPDLEQRYNRFLSETIRLKSELDVALGKVHGMEEGGEILRRELGQAQRNLEWIHAKAGKAGDLAVQLEKENDKLKMTLKGIEMELWRATNQTDIVEMRRIINRLLNWKPTESP